MTYPVEDLLRSLDTASTSPAMRRAQELALTPGVELTGTLGVTMPVSEVVSIWSARLWNMHRVHRRFIGLPALVRTLKSLPPTENIEQVALSIGLKTALVFFNASTHRAVGAVISIRTPADLKRSWENYRMTNGKSSEPVRKRAVSSRREVITSPAIAALQQ